MVFLIFYKYRIHVCEAVRGGINEEARIGKIIHHPEDVKM